MVQQLKFRALAILKSQLRCLIAEFEDGLAKVEAELEADRQALEDNSK